VTAGRGECARVLAGLALMALCFAAVIALSRWAGP
jgi:hypothetical protein